MCFAKCIELFLCIEVGYTACYHWYNVYFDCCRTSVCRNVDICGCYNANNAGNIT